MLETKGHGRRRGLVHDVQHLETGDVARILRGLAADLVEIGRHRDHDLAERPDLGLGISPQLAENEGFDHLGRVLFAFQHLVEDAVAHVALRALRHVLRLAGKSFQRLAAHDHVLPVEQHHAGRDPITLGVDDGCRRAGIVQLAEHGEGRPQIDADSRNGFVTTHIASQCRPRKCRRTRQPTANRAAAAATRPAIFVAFLRENHLVRKRGQSPFVRSTLRAVPANGDCPLFRLIHQRDFGPVVDRGGGSQRRRRCSERRGRRSCQGKRLLPC